MCSIVLAKCNRTTPFGSHSALSRGWKQKSWVYSIIRPDDETALEVSSSGFGEFWNSCVASSRDSPFTSQQVERRVEVNRDASKPASELVDHDSGRNAGGVDRAARGATAALGIGLRE